MRKLLLVAAILVGGAATAQADIICTTHGGCFETGMKIISNGSPFAGLPYKPRLVKDKNGKVQMREPTIRRVFWDWSQSLPLASGDPAENGELWNA
jgi:hypothetical protein